MSPLESQLLALGVFYVLIVAAFVLIAHDLAETLRRRVAEDRRRGPR